MPGLRVLDVRETAHRVDVAVQYATAEATCPGCGRPTWQVHHWQRQRKQDLELWAKPVCLVVETALPLPVMPQGVHGGRPGVWAETSDHAPAPIAPRQGSRGRDRADHGAVASSERRLVQRSWLDTHSAAQPPTRPHRYLGLDGFCVRRPGKMWTGLWDLETRRPVAVVPGQRKDAVEAMLGLHASRRSVQLVCIDLAEGYRQAIRVRLPQAAIVADKFHVIALASRALREVHGQRRQRGNVAWLLQQAVERLSASNRGRLAEALREDAAVRKGWILKEELRAMYRAPSAAHAEAQPGRWIAEAAGTGLAPFVRTARTLRVWRTEVLNYWRHRITNALVEGKHNRVKVLKRRAYGYRNDRMFQLRILNLIHTH